MVSLLRRGTRWNVFGITTHEKFELDGGLMHFLEARMDASFGTTPLAMEKAILLMERGVIDPEKVISHRYPLTQIHQAVETMAGREPNKVVINPQSRRRGLRSLRAFVHRSVPGDLYGFVGSLGD